MSDLPEKYEIVGIGANVHDTLISVSCYPNEDTKLKAKNVKECGGGPCATGLVAASKLGASCAYLGFLSDDSNGNFLREDMKRFGVLDKFVRIKNGFQSFSSYVLLNEENASRTCVFYKGNLPNLILDDEQKNAISCADILMVDGNDLDAALAGAKIAKENGTKVLYDAGGLYDGVEKLLPLADILIPSEEFAMAHTKENNPKDACKKLYSMYSPQAVVVTCGKLGGILFDGKTLTNYPAFPVDAVDSNGSGDVFHGAFAFGLTKNLDYEKCCIFSSAVSALKCTKIGARDGVPKLYEVLEFLEERGYNEFKKDME